MDILQLYIIQNIENSVSNQIAFQRRTITPQSAENAADTQSSVEPAPTNVMFNMANFLNDITFRTWTDKGAAPTRIEKIVERINANETTDDNFILIRNYNQNVVEIDELAAKSFLELVQDDRIIFPTRTAKQIVLENRLAANETILYKIDKRTVNPDTGGEIVQTFYIGRHFDQVRDIHYIDSQVKYGVRYQYEISEIKIVFGNEYSYRDLKVFFHEAAGYGRAVGNALGFYRPVADMVLDDVIESNVKEYTASDEDLGFSPVGIDTVGETSHTGYYIFKPTNRAEIDAPGYTNLFNNGTGWCADSNGHSRRGLVSERLTLEKINVQIKEGFGFTGNDSGGAVGANLNMPVTAVATPPRPPAPKGPRNIRIPKAPLRPTLRRPQFGTTPVRLPQSLPTPRLPSPRQAPRIGTRINRPGGVTPPLSPNLLQQLFRIP
jgi:hypothetical protein